MDETNILSVNSNEIGKLKSKTFYNSPINFKIEGYQLFDQIEITVY